MIHTYTFTYKQHEETLGKYTGTKEEEHMWRPDANECLLYNLFHIFSTYSQNKTILFIKK